MNNYTIKFVSTCKNRLHHVKVTLPLLYEQAQGDIILVDYSCPQNTAQWVSEHYQSVKLIEVESAGFNVAHARNCGAQQVEADFICFIDADVKIKPGFIDWINKNLSPYCFYTAANNSIINYELWGTVIVPTKAYRAIQGYDEVYCGWGVEDDDLYHRLKAAGFYPQGIPPHFLEAIKHGDEERVQFHEIKERHFQFYLNRMYSTAKKQVMAFYRAEGELPLTIRKKLYDAILNTAKKNSNYLEITIDINLQEKLSKKHRLSKSLSLKLSIGDM
jgi:glycosyltransferase involved in cell wall biosynthesis